MLEFDIEDRCDLDCPERQLIAAAMRLWVDDILSDEPKDGPDYRRFKRWDRDGVPPRFRLFCGLLELDVEAVVKALWYRISEQRDAPKHTRKPSQAQLADHRRRKWQAAYGEACRAGFDDTAAKEWADRAIQGHGMGQAA